MRSFSESGFNHYYPAPTLKIPTRQLCYHELAKRDQLGPRTYQHVVPPLVRPILKMLFILPMQPGTENIDRDLRSLCMCHLIRDDRIRGESLLFGRDVQMHVGDARVAPATSNANLTSVNKSIFILSQARSYNVVGGKK